MPYMRCVCACKFPPSRQTPIARNGIAPGRSIVLAWCRRFVMRCHFCSSNSCAVCLDASRNPRTTPTDTTIFIQLEGKQTWMTRPCERARLDLGGSIDSVSPKPRIRLEAGTRSCADCSFRFSCRQVSCQGQICARRLFITRIDVYFLCFRHRLVGEPRHHCAAKPIFSFVIMCSSPSYIHVSHVRSPTLNSDASCFHSQTQRHTCACSRMM